jgi:hypothetical protein
MVEVALIFVVVCLIAVLSTLVSVLQISGSLARAMWKKITRNDAGS